jgi:RHS repeat-associated protein
VKPLKHILVSAMCLFDSRLRMMALLLLLYIAVLSSGAATFTNSFLLSETNALYEGHEIIVDGATLTIDGAHTFRSVFLTNGAVLTHSPCTATETHKLELVVTNEIVISADSQIDVSGRGYLGGYTSGNTTVGAAGIAGGGSYGGLGGGAANRVYGDYADPQDWGSGGGQKPGISVGQPGGGLMRIRGRVMRLDGQLLADGSRGSNEGSGSGGGIFLSVGVLEGGGVVSSNGGESSGSGDSGGGGRVAVYAGEFLGFTVTNVIATGGGRSSGAGTVYLRNTSSSNGTLVIDNRAKADGWTPLGVSGTDLLMVSDAVIIQGESQVRLERDGLILNFQSTLTLADIARLQLGDVLLSGAAKLKIGSNSIVQLAGTLTSLVPLTVEGGTLITDYLIAPGLTLTNGAALTCQTSTTNQMHKLEVDVAGAITVSSNSHIHAHDNGYRAGYTSGNTRTGASAEGSGGSYGGLGAGPRPNAVYGDYADPEDWGSGGGRPNTGAHGGGLIRVRAGSITLDGEIEAAGNGLGIFGGGSGGGVLVAAETLSGNGAIILRGGGVFEGPGGGGGRAAVYAEDLSGFNTNNILVPGGIGAQKGTVYLRQGRLHTHARFTSPGKLSVSPTNNYTVPVRSLADGLTIHFNKAIDTNSFTSDKLSIRGPLGTIVSTGVVQTGDRLYHIAFPQQTENGLYHFTLLPTLLDAEGFMLDQNANGIPGELEDTFSFTLILDIIPPRVGQHVPGGDIAGTITNVDIWFSETIDPLSLTSADIVIRNATNGIVSISSITNVGLNRYRVSFPAQTMVGQYHVLVGTNITDLAGNPLNASYDASFNLVPVDLELTNLLLSTNQLFAGNLAGISWQGRNNSGAPLLGNWIDAAYLSPDPFWNITDILLGTVQHTNGLASNEIYSASLPFGVPGLVPGNYYLIVRADIGNQTRETVETNNFTVYGPIPVSVRSLLIGGNVSSTLTLSNRYHYFAINVAAGESLRLTLDGANGINHLFANYASIPTRLNADIGATSASSNQTITLTGIPGGGTYYVLVSGEQIGSSGNAYTLTVETAPFFVNAITPAVVSGGETLRFWVPLLESNQPAATITGAGFDKNTTVQFLSKGVTLTPSRVEFLSPTALSVFLPINSWPPGVYDVRVIKGATSRTLAGGFTLTNGGVANLEVRIVGTSLSPGGGQTLYVEYRNSGTRATPAPLLKVTAYTNATITTYSINWNGIPGAPPQPTSEAGGGRGGGGEVVPGGVFNVAVPLHSVQAIAIGSSTTPGWLQPGERGRIPFYFHGLTKDRGESSIQFSVGSVTADDTTIVEWPPVAPGVPPAVHFPRHGQRAPLFYWTNGVERPFTVNWAELETRSRPETISADAWNAVWSNLIASTGPLWPDYILMLGDNMNHLTRIGQLTNDPSALFDFEVLQATATLNPVRTLAGTLDASAPSPGFPLEFRRVYNQPILSRYKLGPLGRGWSHNWDISVQILTNFYGVAIHGPNGTDRFFGRFNDGSYTALGGDHGQLIVTNGAFRLIEADKTIWQFNPSNHLDYVADPNGNRITCGYTGLQLTSLTHSSGKQLLLQYNGAGHLSQLTDPLGAGVGDDRITTYEYDGAGEHLIRVTAPGNRVSTYAYHTTGIPQRLHALTNVTHPDLTQDSFAYDTKGRLIQTSQNCCGGAQQVTYAYDSAGTVTVTDASGRITQLLYGLGGQLAQVRDGEGRIVNFSYNDLAQLTQLLGPGGERYRYGYDGLGNLSATEDPLRQVNNFSYEPSLNRLARVRDARGNGLQYAYDTRGNLTAITYADATAERFAYDARGKVIASTNRRGGVITYAYNSAGQLTSKDYAGTPGITDFTYAYDSAGNLTNATYWNPQLATQETLNLQYDPFTDRLTRIEYPGGRFFTFDYDAAGRRTRRADQGGHVTAYLYDALGRLAGMTNELGRSIVTYDYDPAGRLSRKILGNGVFTIYTYNQAGQVTQLVNSRANSSVLSSFAYTYDASGRRDSMTTLTGTETYGYDPLGQLTSVTYPNGRVVTYAYDAAGNRTQVTDNGTPTPYAANPLNQYTSAGAAVFGYDLDGNLTNKTENGIPSAYTYDIENRLVRVTTPTDTWTYTYDGFGNRVAVTHNGQITCYVIDPTGLGNVAAEYGGGGGLIARYEHGFGLLVRSDGARKPAYYTFSAIGHTSELTDPSGVVANAYAYDPFGLSLAKTETIPNPFEFVGEFGVMNEGNGLEFMRNRFYQSSIGHFVQQDRLSVLGGLNRYAYCENNPLSFVDPTGLLTQRQEIMIGIGGLYGGLVIAASGLAIATAPVWGPFVVAGILTLQPLLWKAHEFNETYHADEAIEAWWEQMPERIEAWKRYGESLYEQWQILRFNLPTWDPLNDLKNYWLENQLLIEIGRSRDPNDKLGPSGYDGAAYLPADGTLAYQIRFENQPSATAPAQRVIVADILNPNLDLSTLELTEIAFANQALAIPAGLNHYETRLAFVVTNQTLIPLGDASASALALPPTNTILVEVDAHFDVATRRLTLSLTSIDPFTGWYPENPLLGLLYPNNTNHIGEGGLSYLVRAKSNLVSGTIITNRANIVFDYNDPILTPLVLNTIDSAAPSGAVMVLGATNISPFLVQWSGSDEPGGSGIASYDVYVSEDGTNYFLWLARTTTTSALFNGGAGHTYHFYSVAHDNVGHAEAAPLMPDAHTTVSGNTQPILDTPVMRIGFVGRTLFATNTAFDLDLPAQRLTFSLGGNAPAGAIINPTNGVFRWRPTANYASTTNFIPIIVSDNGVPSLSATQTLVVVVTEYLEPSLGTYVLRAGKSGAVPTRIISSVGLSSLCFTIEYPSNRLDQFALNELAPEIANASIISISSTQSVICFSNYPGQFLIGTQEVANLIFFAVSNQTSAFIPLRISDVHAFGANGVSINNVFVQGGRVVVIGEQPLLEAIISGSGEEQLTVYGHPDTTYRIDKTVTLQPPIWSEVVQITLTNLFRTVTNPVPNHPVEYLRARQQ